MVEDNEVAEAILPTKSVGSQLNEAREARGLSLADVAAKTRIPIRHLEAIERDNFDALPGTTYVLGFVRNYARILEVPDAPLIAALRAELADTGRFEPTMISPPILSDPKRVPPRALAWGALAVVVLLVAGYVAFRTITLGGDSGVVPAAPVAATTTADPAAPPAAVTAPAAPDGGEVVLTAKEPVWLRIYDRGGNRLFEKEMAAGERYSVPADADEPMVLTGRPDAIAVTIGGRAVAPLGPPERTISDVGISAKALLARPPAPATDTAPAPATAPAAATPPAPVPATTE